MRRSEDSGDSWSEPRVVVAGGGQTAGNPAPVVDRMTGRIWLPFVRNDPLGTVERVVRRESWRHPYMTFSDDDGRTWAEPIDVKDQVMEPAWTWYAFGPGHSIQLASGRLLIPCKPHAALGALARRRAVPVRRGLQRRCRSLLAHRGRGRGRYRRVHSRGTG